MPRVYTHVLGRTPGAVRNRRTVNISLGPEPSGGAGQVFEGDGGNNIITGTAFDDTINAYGGSDSINAGAGDDSITSTGGNDTIYGEDGNDYIVYTGGGQVEIYGGNGNDTIDMGLARGFAETGAGSNHVIISCNNQNSKTVKLQGTGDTLEVVNYVTLTNAPEVQVQGFDTSLDTLIIAGDTIDVFNLPANMFWTEHTNPANAVLNFTDSDATLRFIGIAAEVIP